MRYYARPRLVADILANPADVVVIESPVGTGKTQLLREVQAADPTRALLDVEGEGAVLPPGRVIVAKRGEMQVLGLARAAVYGRVSLYDAQDLLFSEADFIAAGESAETAAALMEKTGGWACLLPHVGSDLPAQETLATFLSEELLAELSATQLPALEAYLEGRVLQTPLLAGFPFYAEGALHPVLRLLRAPMRAALAQKRRGFEGDVITVRLLARAEALMGNHPKAIQAAQAKELWGLAIELLVEGGGTYFVHRYGVAALDGVIAGFPEALRHESEVLVLVRAIQAVKHGDARLALHILAAFFGPMIEDAPAFITARQRFSLPARLTRLLMMIWQDAPVPRGFLDTAYALLAEIPIEDDLRRGSFYNSVLEIHLRNRCFAEAEIIAAQAARHFERSGVANLSFFIALHRAQISLHLGRPAKARAFLQEAEGYLQLSPPNRHNQRLIELTQAALAYETGQCAPFVSFLEGELEVFLEGEIWSAVVDLLVSYGSLSMQQIQGTSAARSFLEKWRGFGWQPEVADVLAQTRDILLLQNAKRWHEAGGMLQALRPKNYTEADLRSLAGRDDILLMLAHLRQDVHQDASQPMVLKQLCFLQDNPHLVWRQRISVRIWKSLALLLARKISEAEREILQVLQAVSEGGMVAILAEEQEFLAEILRNRRLIATLEKEESLKRLLKPQRMIPDTAPLAVTTGVTRQEARVLHGVLEGASTKEIANLLGLSTATVKFHLSNLYRKFNCNSRRALKTAALAQSSTGEAAKI